MSEHAFAAALSEDEDARAAAAELVAQLAGAVPESPDLAVLFFTAEHLERSAEMAERIRGELRPRVFLAASAEGVIGAGREVERRPGASLLVGSLPGVVLAPFHAGMADWRRLVYDESALRNRVTTGAEHRGQLLLGDPFTTPIGELLQALDDATGRPTVGGMASAAHAPGMNRLFLNDEELREGVVGVGIGGPVQLDTLVSQGCRPVGEPMVVTRSEGNWILELARRPALEMAEEAVMALPEDDRMLLQAGPFVGIAINEYRDEFRSGDFLVRGLMGVNRETGALAVGDEVRAGQTVQLHVRDAASAHDELAEMLGIGAGGVTPAGALLFSCNGRGTRMFERPDHDANLLAALLPETPAAGFFAAGELGPVGGRSFIHGHTASVAFFRPRRTGAEPPPPAP